MHSNASVICTKPQRELLDINPELLRGFDYAATFSFNVRCLFDDDIITHEKMLEFLSEFNSVR